MPNQDPEGPAMSVAAWLERVESALGGGDRLALDGAEQAALLDLARIAAHASHRTAAPLTTFVAGMALGGLPTGARVARLSEVSRLLESED